MSGDVQPRKRKDKKRKKDDLGVEETRGTAAIFGEGDVFMHSQHDHGTGGHWCAKIIFFSLLAMLVTLIGLIIIENRGLTELEANSVESRYSGVLDGWIEDGPGDDHHDEHTLELKHHDDEDDHDDISNEIDHQDGVEDHNDEDEVQSHEDDEHENELEHDDDNGEAENDEDEDNDEAEDDSEENANDISQEQEDDDEDDEQRDSEENESLQNANEDVDEVKYKKYYKSYTPVRDNDDDDDDDDVDNKDDDDDDVDNKDDDDDDVDNKDDDDDDFDNKDDDDDVDSNDLHKVDENNDDEEESVERNLSDENLENEDEESEENENTSEPDNVQNSDENDETEEDDDDHQDDDDEDENIEVERIEREVSEEGKEEPAPESEEGKEDNLSQDEDLSKETADSEYLEDEEVEFLEPDDDDLPIVVEHITAPAGKPLVEVEDETSSEKPPDTLAEEEEYEKQQEELRRQKEESSQVWLKLVVGGALLVATHAVVRRATTPRDTPGSSERVAREETPITDRRMTLIAEEVPVVPIATPRTLPQEPPETFESEAQRSVPKLESVPQPMEESEEEDVEDVPIATEEVKAVEEEDSEDKELYSDEEEEEDDEEIVKEKPEPPKAASPVQSTPIQKEKTPEPEPAEDDEPEDVEIIDDEQLEDELEEEIEDEEEISDVDDEELLSRLEAKYGKLPAPERPGRNPKDGGQSLEDDWPGEPSDPYWRRQLDQAEKDFQKGEWSSAMERAGVDDLRTSARGRWIVARALDSLAETKRDNQLLSRAITAYLDLLKMNERLKDKMLLEITSRTLDRIQFRGNYLSAEPIYRLLIRRFPNDVSYRNNLTVSFLMANRVDLAEEALKETLKLWPNDRVALAHLGFVLKTQHNRLEEAVEAFQKALEGDTGPATEPRFYYHYGDSLLLLGRFKEAHEVHKRGAALGHFLSPAQRSLYNVDRLKSRPWWNIENTPYMKLARALEKSWKDILKEGEAARALYEKEKEGLKERGEWSQLDLFVRGREIPDRCKRAPVTCSIVKAEPAASGCRRGQIKFSSMEAGTHVRPHVGPTNCRLRMHLGLSNTKDTYIRVDQETRQWQTGKALMFDDSFEHEVWHNGTGTRLVLIVDVWHPDLTPTERRQLPAI